MYFMPIYERLIKILENKLMFLLYAKFRIIKQIPFPINPTFS